MVRRGTLVIASIVVGLVAAVVALKAIGEGPGSTVQVGNLQEEREELSACTAGRWDVKTVSDPAASAISRIVRPSTVTALAALPAPGVDERTPRLAQERQLIRIPVELYADHLEPDLDVHLVVLEPGGPTTSMIVELPDARCLKQALPRLRPQLIQARRAYELGCGPASTEPGTYYVRARATVTGVRFFDTIERQFRRAPNAIELHPVTGISIDGPCEKFAGRTRFSVTGSIADRAVITGSEPWQVSVDDSAAAKLTSVEFFVDGTRVGRQDQAPWLLPGGLAAVPRVGGTHYLAAVATLKDGSTSRLTIRVTRTGSRPELTVTPTSVASGGRFVVRASSFQPSAAGTLTVSRAGVVLIRSSISAFDAMGLGVAMGRIPTTARSGTYVVRVCQSGCRTAAKGRLVVR